MTSLYETIHILSVTMEINRCDVHKYRVQGPLSNINNLSWTLSCATCLDNFQCPFYSMFLIQITCLSCSVLTDKITWLSQHKTTITFTWLSQYKTAITFTWLSQCKTAITFTWLSQCKTAITFTCQIVRGSHKYVILKKYYKHIFVLFQDAA